MKPGVLLLGSEPRVIVPVARSLHSHGIRCVVAGTPGLALRSRAVLAAVSLLSVDSGRERWIEGVERIAREFALDTIIPTSDSALEAMLLCGEHFPGSLASPEAVRTVLDKGETARLAREVGIPVPDTYEIPDVDALRRELPRLRFPLVAKPRSKRQPSTFKVRYYLSGDELVRTFSDRPAFGRENLIQMYIAGVGRGVGVVVRRGEILHAFQHRRLREVPYTGGVSALAVSEAIDPRLLRYTQDLLARIGWEGVAMVEFKDDGNTPYLMEVNGRYWGTISLAIQAGVDFPLYDWTLRCAKSLPSTAAYRAGVKCRWLAGDLERLVSRVRHGAESILEPPPILEDLWGTVQAFSPRVGSMLWSWRDPLPQLGELVRLAQKLGRGSLEFVLGAVLPVRARTHLRTLRSLSSGERRIYLSLLLRDRRREFSTPVRVISILCFGNIIRSAFLEESLRQALRARDVGEIVVRSAGVNARAGDAADSRAVAAAREVGIELSAHRASPADAEFIHGSDVVLAVDRYVGAKLLHRFPEARRKVFLLGELLPRPFPVEFPDPYTGTAAQIQECCLQLHQAAAHLADALCRNLVRHQLTGTQSTLSQRCSLVGRASD